MKNITVYTCKDGRTRAYIKETKKVVSYPRLLLEEKLGRKLATNEQVHHIDGNPLNNDVDNLEISMLGEHQLLHNQPKYFDKTAVCVWCGKEFTWTVEQQRRFRGNRKRIDRVCTNTEPFCSKSCAAKHGRQTQLKNR